MSAYDSGAGDSKVAEKSNMVPECPKLAIDIYYVIYSIYTCYTLNTMGTLGDPDQVSATDIKMASGYDGIHDGRDSGKRAARVHLDTKLDPAALIQHSSEGESMRSFY